MLVFKIYTSFNNKKKSHAFYKSYRDRNFYTDGADLYRGDGVAVSAFNHYYCNKQRIQLIDLIGINHSNIHKNNDII